MLFKLVSIVATLLLVVVIAVVTVSISLPILGLLTPIKAPLSLIFTDTSANLLSSAVLGIYISTPFPLPNFDLPIKA